MSLLGTQLLQQRILRKLSSAGGGGGLDGIFEIECGSNGDAYVDFYYIVNSANVYVLKNVFVFSPSTIFTPYVLPANFSELTFYVLCADSGGTGNLNSYSKTMTSGANGITGDSGNFTTGIVTFSILRNSHQYLRLLLEPP